MLALNEEARLCCKYAETTDHLIITDLLSLMTKKFYKNVHKLNLHREYFGFACVSSWFFKTEKSMYILLLNSRLAAMHFEQIKQIEDEK